MARDRLGEPLTVGQAVMLTKGMGVGRKRKAIVSAINGEDVYVIVMVNDKPVAAHRYGCEMEGR